MIYCELSRLFLYFKNLRIDIDYVFQEHRYQLVEEEGCVLTAGTTGLSILVYDVPSIVLPLISALYYSRRWNILFSHSRLLTYA